MVCPTKKASGQVVIQPATMIFLLANITRNQRDREKVAKGFLLLGASSFRQRLRHHHVLFRSIFRHSTCVSIFQTSFQVHRHFSGVICSAAIGRAICSRRPAGRDVFRSLRSMASTCSLNLITSVAIVLSKARKQVGESE